MAYEACNCMYMPLHTPKTLETCKKKKALLVWFKKLQVVQQITCLKQQCFLSFTFYKTQWCCKKFMCIYFLFHWFSGANCMFVFSLYKGWQISKELKRNMNDGTRDGTIIFLMFHTYHLNLKNLVSLFFLIQDNFMF